MSELKFVKNISFFFLNRYLQKAKSIDFIFILIIIILPVIILKDLALDHKIPFFLDPLTQFFPFRSFAADMINNGNIPLWNPYSFSGTPFLANIQTAVFYPPNIILYYLLSLRTAFSLSFVLHFIIAGFFTYLFLRKIKISPFGCLLGGVSFMFSGFIFPKIALPPLLQTTALIPFVFFCFELAFEKRKIQHILCAGISLCIFILSGYPHLIHSTLIVLGLYSLFRIKFIEIERSRDSSGKKMRFVKYLDLLIRLGVLYTTVIFLTGGFTLSFWGFEFSSHDIRKPLYFVGLMILLRLFSSIKKIYILKKWRLFHKGQIIFIIIIIIGVALSAVQFFPSLEFTQLSHQAKIVHLKENMRGLRPSFGLDLLLGHREDVEGRGFIGTLTLIFILMTLLIRLKRPYHFYLFLGLSLFVLLVCFRFGPLIALLWHVPGFKLFPVMQRNVAILTFTLAALAAISFDILAERFRRLNRRLFKSGLFQFVTKTAIFLLVAAQLIHSSSFIKTFIDSEKFFKKAKSINFLKRDKDFYRIFEVGVCSEFYRDYPKINVAHFLVPNTGLLYKISDIQGYDPLQLNTYKDYIRSANLHFNFYPEYHYSMSLPLESNFMNLLNVKYILSNKYMESMGREDYKLVLDTDVKIYENEAALPRTFIVHQWTVAKNHEEIFHWIQKKLINPRKTVVFLDHFAGVTPAESYRLGDNDVSSKVNISVSSAGMMSGDYAEIVLSGERVEQGGRGYNMAVINPETGSLEQSIFFDTSATGMQSKLMAEFLNAVKPGMIVVAAVKDDASNALTKEAVQALRTIGAVRNLRREATQNIIDDMLKDMRTFIKRHGEYFNVNIIRAQSRIIRWSHAVIGMKGLMPGEAIEMARPGVSAVHFPQTIPAVHVFKDENSSAQKSEEAKILYYSPNKIIIEAKLTHKGFLVLSEIYYPGWKAYVDGIENPIYRADSIFRALYLEKGRHKIEFRYSPLSFKRGLVISTVSMAVVVLGFLFVLGNHIVRKIRF